MVVAIASLLALNLISCGGSDEPTSPQARRDRPRPRNMTITPGGHCRVPAAKEMPRWFPKGLPLPEGTYFYREVFAKGAFHRGLFVMSLDTGAFFRFVQAQWRKAGVFVSRQDREPGEVESFFTFRGGTGVFKANDVICDPPYTRLSLVYGT